MNNESRSTVAFRSNLQPVKGSCLNDINFLKKIRDPFALYELNELLKKYPGVYFLTAIQQEEYRKASSHCSYALKNDFPWGTIKQEDGTETVICKCINKECKYFHSCRPDFSESELDIIEENKKYAEIYAEYLDISEFCKRSKEEETEEPSEELIKNAVHLTEEVIEHIDELTDISSTPEVEIYKDTSNVKTYDVEIPSKFAIFPPKTVENEPIVSCKIHINLQEKFASFIEVSQEKVVKGDATERTLVNAGPGTGKTWALIEKLIYLVEEKGIDPEGILVLCFSRAAVEVIEKRLQAASVEGRIGHNWRKIEIRTFDSFSTYMIAWVRDFYPDLLPSDFLLEKQDYDTRIYTAINLLKKKKDMFSQYEHIFVDEIQDLVDCRAELVLQILSILPAHCGFTLLGDACQAIYDWLAKDDPSMISSEDFYSRLFTRYRDINCYSFTINHRQDSGLLQIAELYRKAILTGTADERVNAIKEINCIINDSSLDKLQNISLDYMLGLLKSGTVSILTRTNGQALKISTLLNTADIPHALLRPANTSHLADWIAKVFMVYPYQTINEELFTKFYLELYPSTNMEQIKSNWHALVSTQYGSKNSHYNVEDLLKGLYINARDQLLFTPTGVTGPIVVSNIHRAKGREFDTVLVVDDVLQALTYDNKDDIQEHKVCYVALTRPKKQLLKINMKNQYIYIDKGAHRRCFQSGGYKHRLYLSHIEIGFEGDLINNAFALSSDYQNYIQSKLTQQTRLKLRKCPEKDMPFIMYRIVPEDNENKVLGYTGKPFSDSIQRALQRIFNRSHWVDYRYYPNTFSDIYVDSLITCISISDRELQGAKYFGNTGIWMGFTVSGFAQIEKDRY